jgi:hypothetical protein
MHSRRSSPAHSPPKLVTLCSVVHSVYDGREVEALGFTKDAEINNLKDVAGEVSDGERNEMVRAKRSSSSPFLVICTGLCPG